MEKIKLHIRENRHKPEDEEIIISPKTRYLIVLVYALSVIVASFFFNTPKEILMGLKKIILAPSIILTDYMELANIGAALFNGAY